MARRTAAALVAGCFLPLALAACGPTVVPGDAAPVTLVAIGSPAPASSLAATTTTDPRVEATTTTAAEGPTTTEGPDEPSDGASGPAPVLPKRYVSRHTDLFGGVDLKVPEGWRRGASLENRLDYRDPGGGVLLRFEFLPASADDYGAGGAYQRLGRQMAAWREYPDFEFIAHKNFYCCGQDSDPQVNSAEGEFTFVLDGVRRHVLARGIVHGERGYMTVYFSTPAAHFTRMKPVAQRALEYTLGG
jgi:eukaryotic-like serine/threonine-protein kinase